MQREPKRLAHRAAERARQRAFDEWISEEIDEALDTQDTQDSEPPARGTGAGHVRFPDRSGG